MWSLNQQQKPHLLPNSSCLDNFSSIIHQGDSLGRIIITQTITAMAKMRKIIEGIEEDLGEAMAMGTTRKSHIIQTTNNRIRVKETATRNSITTEVTIIPFLMTTVIPHEAIRSQITPRKRPRGNQ
jgi:hypothetical protein